MIVSTYKQYVNAGGTCTLEHFAGDVVDRHSKRGALSADCRGAVGDRYVKSNRATAELTGLDLDSYGWLL
jgi:hypothetical protein